MYKNMNDFHNDVKLAKINIADNELEEIYSTVDIIKEKILKAATNGWSTLNIFDDICKLSHKQKSMVLSTLRQKYDVVVDVQNIGFASTWYMININDLNHLKLHRVYKIIALFITLALTIIYFISKK